MYIIHYTYIYHILYIHRNSTDSSRSHGVIRARSLRVVTLRAALRRRRWWMRPRPWERPVGIQLKVVAEEFGSFLGGPLAIASLENGLHFAAFRGQTIHE